MRIFNSYSQQKTKLKKPPKGFIKMFVCGPTVYDYSHIGHARTYIIYDAFVKYLRSKKIKIFYLQNITDIDDKIINRSREQKINPLSLAKKFEKEYLKDMKALKTGSVDKYARASDHIKEIQNQIKKLITKGCAYQIKNGIYFEVKKFNDYGKLSKQNLEELRPGYRIEPDAEKCDPLDFVLWKINPKLQTANFKQTIKSKFQIKNGEPLWQSPWGWGRPGWHIEDTAITEKYFGAQYDLHGGGNDLKFPHHEAEIAQMESVSGKKPLVKIWMHTGFLLVNGEKMSKSLGNFITIREFLKNYSKDVLRMAVFSSHYRAPFDYNENVIKQSMQSLKTIRDFLEKLEFIIFKKIIVSQAGALIEKNLKKFENDFESALNDDFNIPKALASLFELISLIQVKIWKINSKDAKKLYNVVAQKMKVFEIDIKTVKIPAKIRDLSKKRELYRKNKQFIQSDSLRKKIEMLGYLIEDTPLGPLVQGKS
ncbi:MAG: cysteine--tRNA ligase [Patescibacteria group bacterium]|nr:cysteine--tRNA ligase [Patescibacteria group bacterium]